MTVDLAGDVGAGRIPDDVATTAFFVASEAMANAVKHASPALIGLRVSRADGRLTVQVRDDGRGGAAVRPGAGLAGIADRVAAVGGALSLSSPVGGRHDRGGDAAVRIVIGEDSALFREGLARLLEDAGHEIVAKAADAPSLVAAVDATAARPGHHRRPDAAGPDRRRSPRGAGRRGAHPELGIVLLSQHVETRHSVELVASGRFGYLLKDRVFDVDDFLDALRRVAAGGSALDPEVVSRLIGVQPRRRPDRHTHPARTRGARADGRRAHQRRESPAGCG